ncbi:MAG: ABC transporter permease subunit, partial [Calditrichia bacterium]
MNKLAYPLFIWKSHRGLAIFSILFITALQFLIIFLITSFDTAPIISAILKQIPQRFRILFGEQLVSMLSVRGAAAFGFNHPMVITLLSINAIIIPTRHISGEIESGTLELLMAYPLSRTKLLLSLWFSGGLYLFIIVFCALAGSLTGIAIYDQLTPELITKMCQIGINLWLLFLLIMSYTLLISTFGKEGSKTGMSGAFVLLLFYFLFFISSVWDLLKFTQTFNIFTYYQPQKLMFGLRSLWLNIGVLGMLTSVCLFISLKQFN